VSMVVLDVPVCFTSFRGVSGLIVSELASGLPPSFLSEEVSVPALPFNASFLSSTGLRRSPTVLIRRRGGVSASAGATRNACSCCCRSRSCCSLCSCCCCSVKQSRAESYILVGRILLDHRMLVEAYENVVAERR